MIYDTIRKTYWKFVRLEPRIERLLELRKQTVGKLAWVKIKDINLIGPELDVPMDSWKNFCKKSGIPSRDQKDAAWLVMLAGPHLLPDLYRGGVKAAWTTEYQCVNFLWVLEDKKALLEFAEIILNQAAGSKEGK